MKYIRELLLSVALIALVVLGYRYTTARHNLLEADRIQETLQLRLDSVTQLQHEAELNAMRMHTEYNKLKEKLLAQSILTEVWRVKYEAVKNTPVKRLSDAGIDSALTRLYPHR
jgi:hypothetical protein